MYKCNNGYQTFIRKGVSRSWQMIWCDIAKVELAESPVNVCADLNGWERFHIRDERCCQSNVPNQMQFWWHITGGQILRIWGFLLRLERDGVQNRKLCSSLSRTGAAVTSRNLYTETNLTVDLRLIRFCPRVLHLISLSMFFVQNVHETHEQKSHTFCPCVTYGLNYSEKPIKNHRLNVMTFYIVCNTY